MLHIEEMKDDPLGTLFWPSFMEITEGRLGRKKKILAQELFKAKEVALASLKFLSLKNIKSTG